MEEMRHCLLIDDDQDDQEIFLMCIKKLNTNVTCLIANDAVEAIAMIKSTPGYIPNYTFIDVNMPKMNGIDCLKILKKIERLKYTKIFMYSTTSERVTLVTSKELGAEDFIIKPATTKELKEKLSKIFEIVSVIDK
jgi:CheY-like chemotaxis protein